MCQRPASFPGLELLLLIALLDPPPQWPGSIVCVLSSFKVWHLVEVSAFDPHIDSASENSPFRYDR